MWAVGIMKARPNRYSVSLAPTGRARCRGCKGLVERGEVRVVTHATIKPGRGTCFVRHAACVSVVFARAVMAACEGDVDRVCKVGDVRESDVARVRESIARLGARL